MSRVLREPGSRVKEALRFGDPAVDDGSLAADERIRMRAGLSRETGVRPAGRGRRWQPAFALCTALLLAGVLWYRLTPALSRLVSPPAASAAKPAVEPESDGRQVSAAASMHGSVQQIQFVTKGGTRVIWLLNPRFKL